MRAARLGRQPIFAVIAVAVLGSVMCTVGCRGRKPPAESSPQAAAPQPLPPRDIPILCMHDVGPNAKNEYSIRTADLEQYAKWLSSEGYETVTVRDVAAFLNHEGELPPKPVVLSFDDNWKSALTVVKPILDRYGFIGVACVMTDNVGTGGRKLTWNDCKALAAAGWEIASHTRTHENLTRVPRGKTAESLHPMVEDQVRGSRDAIGTRAGLEAATLALPYGNYDTFVLRTAKDAGYTAALTIDRGVADERSDPMLLPRRMIVNGTSFSTFKRVCSTKTLHLDELDPPPGTRVGGTPTTVAAVLADPDVTSAPQAEVQGKRVAVTLDPASRRITLKADLDRGANSIALAGSGREVSWLLIRD
jgi:peptidoglycan/xylan/chitin deacetylase (PgdA/CDA1 family)